MLHSIFTNFNRHIQLTGEEKDIVQVLFTEKKIKKHKYVLQEGDVCRHETYLIKGLTRTYETDEKGNEHILQFGAEDWWVGDLFSFLSGQPSRYNIECLEDCEVLQISKANLDKLYQQVPKMERYFRIMLQNAFIATSSRIISGLSKPAAERYLEFTEKYPGISQRIPDKQVALFLGITPQSLSRIRRRK